MSPGLAEPRHRVSGKSPDWAQGAFGPLSRVPDRDCTARKTQRTGGTGPVKPLIAAFLAFASTQVFGNTASRYRLRFPALSQDDRRASEPPRLAGSFLFLGLAIGLALLRWLIPVGMNWIALLGVVSIYLVGLLDDFRPLEYGQKFVLQTLAAAVPVLAGVYVSTVRIPGIGTLELGYYGPILSLVFLLFATNSFNLIDGVDGLATGLGMITSLGLAVAACLLGETGVSLLGFAVFAASAAVLPLTRNPARFYLGDSGSHLLGYTAGLMALMLLQKEPRFNPVLAILLLLVPTVDTAYAVVRRLWQGRHPFHRDESHVHHRLGQAGLSPRQICAVLWSVNALSAAVATGLLLS